MLLSHTTQQETGWLLYFHKHRHKNCECKNRAKPASMMPAGDPGGCQDITKMFKVVHFLVFFIFFFIQNLHKIQTGIKKKNIMVTTSKNGCVENMAENVPTECTDTAVRLQHVQPQKPSQYQPSTFKHSFVSRVIKSPYSQKLHSQPIRLELARSRKYFLILSANGL